MSSNRGPYNNQSRHCQQDGTAGQPSRVEHWFRRTPGLNAAIRLFCFPYAGGNVRMFRDWHQWFKPEIEIVAVELPGHGSHSRSPLIDNMSVLIESLLPAIDPLLDKPFALFGHSMGALISFELSRALNASGRRRPLHLFASGMRAPHLRGDYKIHDLPDRQFVEALRALNGTPSEILADSSLLEMFIPVLRADLRLAETYRFTPGPILEHPVTVFGGLRDVAVTVDKLHEWKRHTRKTCSVRLVEGDHFFIQQHAHVVAASILKSLGKMSLPPVFQIPTGSPDLEATSRPPEPVFSGTD